MPVDESSLMVNFIQEESSSYVVQSDSRLEKIRDATQKDDVLQQLRATLHSGWSTYAGATEAVRPYFNFRDEITEDDGIIYKGQRIIIPTSLRRKFLQKLHTGHMGESKCLIRARTYMFWPGLTKDVIRIVQRCTECQTYQDAPPQLNTRVHDIPEVAWTKLGMDIFTQEERKYLITVDYSSRYPVVNPVKHEKSATVTLFFWL